MADNRMHELRAGKVVLDVKDGTLLQVPRLLATVLSDDQGQLMIIGLLDRRKWNIYPEFSPYSDLAGEVDATAQQFDQLFCHAQADPRAFDGACLPTQAIECFKYLVPLIRGYTLSGVGDVNSYLVRCGRLAFYCDCSVLAIVFDGVRQPVQNDFYKVLRFGRILRRIFL